MKDGDDAILIDRLEDLEPLAGRWQEVYDADPDAHVFASWPWFRGFLDLRPHAWAVLVVRVADQPVAFWPVEPRTVRRLSVLQTRELHQAAGGLGDYTGLACIPEHRGCVVAAVTRFMAGWDRICLRDVRDARLDEAIAALVEQDYESVPQAETCCRMLDLPGNWEAYLMETLATKVRRNVRRSLRELENAPGIEIEEVNAEHLPERLAAMFHLWQQRFTEVSPAYVEGLSSTFSSCHRAGAAFLTVVKRGGEVMAGVARFLDAKKGVVHELMNTFHPDFREVHSPGQVVVALSIQHAIERGCRTYDFLRGDEKYKEDLGGKALSCHSVELSQKGMKGRVIGLADRLRGRAAQP